MPLWTFGHSLLHFLEWSFLLPTIGGSVYAVLSLLAVVRLRVRTQADAATPAGGWPAVTILKPVFGVEKHQRENLRSTCIQDYPSYQVVFSVQGGRSRPTAAV